MAITPKDSSALEIVPSGTVMTGVVVSITAHTGTSWRIMTGTYHAAEEGYPGDVADIYAIEGEWKICNSNKDNLMVVDVATFPLARNSQNCGSNDGNNWNQFEFPHHHFTPQSLSGTSSEFWDGSSSSRRAFGMTTHGDYVFFHTTDSTGETMCRKGVSGGGLATINDAVLNAMGYEFTSECRSFSVIDDSTVMIWFTDYPDNMHYYFATYNFDTFEFRIILEFPFPAYTDRDTLYLWHWGIVGTRLCISAAISTYVGDFLAALEYYKWYNYIYDYTTGACLATHITNAYFNYNLLQYPVCNDVIIGKKYHVEYHFGTSDSSDPAYKNDAQLFVFDCESNTISRYNPYYISSGDTGLLGSCSMTHLIENPFNHMMYFIAQHSYFSGGHWHYGYSVQIMSPGNYSNATVYEYVYQAGTTPDKGQIPAILVSGMWGAYCVMGNGDVYNVTDFNAFIINIPDPFGANDWYGYGWDYPQPLCMASCLDRWDRLWYLDAMGYLRAFNFVTMALEDSVYIDGSFDPTDINHIYLARDRIFVLMKYGYSYSKIFMVE